MMNTGYIFAVKQVAGELVYPSGNSSFIYAEEARHLVESIAAFEVHLHQCPVFSVEDIRSCAEKVNTVSVIYLKVLQLRGCLPRSHKRQIYYNLSHCVPDKSNLFYSSFAAPHRILTCR